jgi:hypothetical protein
MKARVALLVLLTATNVSLGQGEVFPWSKIDEKTSRPPTIEKDGTILVKGSPDLPFSTTILIVDNPKAPSHQYRLVGKVKYENVEGDGFLEMLNHFPKQGAFFTRTLAPDGLLGKITGTSNWRDIQLPFYSKPGMLPDKLVVNVVLPKTGGRVWISPLKLEPAEPMETAETAAPFSWALVAAMLSGLVGLLGALVAVLAGNPALRRAALSLTMLLVPCSLAALVAGVVLWSRETGQNTISLTSIASGVWLFLLAAGVLIARRKIAHAELRRIQAFDASPQ